VTDLSPTATDAFLRPITGGAVARLAIDAKPRPPRRTADGRLIGRGVRPSAAVADVYQRRLLALVDEMNNSASYWISAAYRRDDERIASLAGLAADAPPSAVLQDVIKRLRRRWLRRFDEGALDLAKYFAKAAHRRTDEELRKILKRAGISVEFKVSREVQSALRAIVNENVSLIRSIPEQFLTQVEGSVMRSVLAGRDLKTLTEEIQHQHGVTRRRAELIALQQNNSATGAIQRLQYIELGIERAIWRHSAAGREPRPTHAANDGNEYDVATGWLDPHEGRYIRPGELINCRCWSQPILPR
jgi:uncharacterized protein with gpF-like domain